MMPRVQIRKPFFGIFLLGAGTATILVTIFFLNYDKYGINSSHSKSLYRRNDLESDKSVLEMCKSIIYNPQPWHDDCARPLHSLKCSNGTEHRLFSQTHQDFYLYKHHFKHLKRPGTYLDIAANDPIFISNTFFFDRCLGWKGICVEGNPYYFEPIYRLRTCELVPTCVSNQTNGKIIFSMDGVYGGIIDDSYKNKQRNVPITIEEQCTTAEIVTNRYNIQIIDYFSLDVEGHELEVLQGFDWKNVLVKVLVVEKDEIKINKIEKFLEKRGYRRFIPKMDKETSALQLFTYDAIFLHHTVVFGDPN